MQEHVLLSIAIMLAAAKIGGEICERWLKQPAVLGEIVFGMLIGGSCCHWVDGGSATLGQIAEIGAVLLLFEVGLESDIEELFRVGPAALWVACAGVLLPFGMGYGTATVLGQATMQAIFVGAAMTATSVGITARVFSDMRALATREAKIVLGAAVADDVIGLIILAAVSGLAVTKTISWLAIGKLTGMAVLFLVGAVIVGLIATPYLLTLARKMQTRAALSAAALIFCFLLAVLAEHAQLAPIVGAFAAGLVLAKTEHKIHFEPQVKSVADIFVPLFFVMMGARIQLSMFNPGNAAGRATLILGSLLVVIAVIGKVLAGLTVPGRGLHRWTIGIGMIPRGEVGLIFASIGLQRHVIDDALYAAIIFVVVFTTFITPPLLKMVAGKIEEPAAPQGMADLERLEGEELAAEARRRVNAEPAPHTS